MPIFYRIAYNSINKMLTKWFFTFCVMGGTYYICVGAFALFYEKQRLGLWYMLIGFSLLLIMWGGILLGLDISF